MKGQDNALYTSQQAAKLANLLLKKRMGEFEEDDMRRHIWEGIHIVPGDFKRNMGNSRTQEEREAAEIDRYNAENHIPHISRVEILKIIDTAIQEMESLR